MGGPNDIWVIEASVCAGEQGTSMTQEVPRASSLQAGVDRGEAVTELGSQFPGLNHQRQGWGRGRGLNYPNHAEA